jgi:hypothetical protein
MQTSQSASTEEIFHTAYILVGLNADEVSLHEKDPRVRITEEFILYRPLRTDGDGPVEVVFQCTVPGYTLALEPLEPLPPTVTLLEDRVALPLRTQLKIRVDLEPTAGNKKPKVPLDITIKTRKRGGGNL